MAIPFYENEDELHQQQHVTEEIDQVDGPVIQSPNAAQNQQGLNSSPYANTFQQVNQVSVNQQDFMAWKILALAMCKALKDHYQQNMAHSSSSSNTLPTANAFSSAVESATAVIQILPNGQVKPQWN